MGIKGLAKLLSDEAPEVSCTTCDAVLVPPVPRSVWPRCEAGNENNSTRAEPSNGICFGAKILI